MNIFNKMMGNSIEKPEIPVTYDSCLENIKKVVETWTKSGEGVLGYDERTARNLEKEQITKIITFLQNNPEIVEEKKEELKFVIEEYMRIGDYRDLMKQAGDLVGIHDVAPDLAALQVKEQIVKMREPGEEKGATEKMLEDIAETNKDKKIH